MTKVAGGCPMGCGETLFVGNGGRITCSLIGCPKPAAVDELLNDAPVLRAEMDFVVALLRDAKADRVPIPAVEMVYAAVTMGQLATMQVLRDAEELVACERLVAAAPARLRGLMGPMLEESRRDLALRWVRAGVSRGE